MIFDLWEMFKALGVGGVGYLILTPIVNLFNGNVFAFFIKSGWMAEQSYGTVMILNYIWAMPFIILVGALAWGILASITKRNSGVVA